MAIVVKGKICLCKTSLSDWSPERVNGILFYDRYQDFVKLFSAKIPNVDFERCFAQPVYNDETNAIEWFCSPMEEYPVSLQEVPDASAEAEKNRITTAISKAASSLSDNDRKYLAPILLTLQSDKIDSVTYHCGGQVVFGIWGMSMKKGRVISDVIIDDIKDHRTHHVTYKVQGKGKVSFSDIVRRHGHVLGGEADIPTLIPAPGYLVKAWVPESPSGTNVDKPLHFTVVFEKDPSYVPAEPEEPAGNIGEVIDEPKKGVDTTTKAIEEQPVIPQPPVFKVRFVSDDRGILRGQTEYEKKAEERILAVEVPHVEPKEGYRFIGWDKQPVDYVVREETVFTALYEPIEKKDKGFWSWWWLSGCLNWLLALLLLWLIGLLLWFLFGNHNLNFCGDINEDCDCEKEEIYVHDTIIMYDTTKTEKPQIIDACQELNSSGKDKPVQYLFNMGQPRGSFLFEYATGGKYADRIIIYDGTTRQDPVIFEFHGITGDAILNSIYNEPGRQIVNFSNQYVLVDIIPDLSPQTQWEIKVNCPEQ